MNIYEVLRLALSTGEQVNLVYAYGSRAGQSRPLKVLEFINNDEALRVQEPGEDSDRTYVVARIISVTVADGTTAFNAETERAYRQYEASKREAERRRQELFYTCVHGSLNKLIGCSITLKTTGDTTAFTATNTAHLTARSVINAYRAAYALHLIKDHSQGYYWDVLGPLVQAKLWWPNFMKLQRLGYEDAQRLKTTIPDWHTLDFKQRVTHYEKSSYWGEYGWQYLEWGQMFEADLDMAKTLDKLSTVSLYRNEFKQYILGSNGERRPLKLPNEDITCMDWLKKYGLVEIPQPRDILHAMKLTELRQVAQALSLKTTGMKKPDLVELLDGKVDIPIPEDTFMLNPLKGMTWHELQSFKSTYRKMIQCLVAHLEGNLEGKPEVLDVLTQ